MSVRYTGLDHDTTLLRDALADAGANSTTAAFTADVGISARTTPEFANVTVGRIGPVQPGVAVPVSWHGRRT